MLQAATNPAAGYHPPEPDRGASACTGYQSRTGTLLPVPVTRDGPGHFCRYRLPELDRGAFAGTGYQRWTGTLLPVPVTIDGVPAALYPLHI